MTKTKKNATKKNATKKNAIKQDLALCPIGLKPFEENFSKTLTKGHLKKSSEEHKKHFVKQLLSKFAPNNVKPKDNFYDYINYNWLREVTLEEQQKYIVQIDDFRLTQDKVYKELNVIILDYIKTHHDKLATNLKNFYNSVIKMNSINEGRKMATDAVKTIDALVEGDNMWKMLAVLNSDEMIADKAPFVWSVNPDTMLARTHLL